MVCANWARTLKRLRRNAEELVGHGWTRPEEPAQVEIPPSKRGAIQTYDHQL
jgi:hypothetical protein